MNYSGILHNDMCNGEGVRVTLFVSGCKNNCKGCHNPETHDYNYGQEFDVAAKMAIENDLKTNLCDGLTIINKTKDEIKIPSGIFYDGIDGYILRVGEQEEDGLFHDVMVYDHTSYEGNNNITLAESGYITITPDKKNLVFSLNNGTTYSETIDISYTDTVLDQSVITFDKQTLYISLDDYSFSRSDDNTFGNEVMAKDLKTLRHDEDSLSKLITEEKFFYVRRFFYDSQINHYDQIDTASRIVPPSNDARL